MKRGKLSFTVILLGVLLQNRVLRLIKIRNGGNNMYKKIKMVMVSLALSVMILMGDVMYVPAMESIPFSVGQNLSGTVADHGKVYYQFSLNSKKTITLDTTANDDDLGWEIRNDKDEWICGDSYVSNYNQFANNYTDSYSTTLSKGTYYLIVLARLSKPVTYSIKTSVVDAGAVSNASGSSENIKIGIRMKRKKSLQLMPFLTGMSGHITWKSSKKSVAKISSKGKVKARKRGMATITAKCKGKKATIEIVVY